MEWSGVVSSEMMVDEVGANQSNGNGEETEMKSE
jgi:hypothetical protein